MDEALIIGSGPAAVGAALALTSAGVVPTVVDIGAQLDPENRSALERIRHQGPDAWGDEDMSLITSQPVTSQVEGLPEKRSYGSNFAFRDVGQLVGVRAEPGAHRAVISGAYGGFSSVWGSQLMPFTSDTLDEWPCGAAAMETHYRAVLGEVPLVGHRDDLSEQFPLFAEPSPLPLEAERTSLVMARYDRHRDHVRGNGVTVGHARLAVSARTCVRCGLCMTGCPYGLIYSAGQTIDRLRSQALIRYIPNMLALRICEVGGRPQVRVRDVRDGRISVLDADRVFVACGALGTTRLIASSLGLHGATLPAQESAQFALPAISMRPTADPRHSPRFTLNQFNMVLRCGPKAPDISQTHFYTYNDAFAHELPRFMRADRMEVGRRELLRRLTVGIGYLPSWASPKLALRFEAAGDDGLSDMIVARERFNWSASAMYRRVKQQMRRVAADLDLWPVFELARYAAGGKTYHFGSTFGHSQDPGETSTDTLGRLATFTNVHLVDASVFPAVPATTFTFTIMANAHRIASQVASALDTATVAASRGADAAS